jgi:D-xylose reductase
MKAIKSSTYARSSLQSGVLTTSTFSTSTPVALKYVDPKVRYPLGRAFDGKNDIQLANAPIQETWIAMEALVEKGLTRSIGISNFQGSLILDLLRYAKVCLAALQIEHHLYLVQPTLTKLAESEGIAVVAYSTFGPTSFIELDWKKPHDTPVLFDHTVITKIAKQHLKTPAQVILRWVTQRGIAVVPKSNSQSRLEQNLYVTDFNLKDDEIEAISGLDRNLRFNNPTDVSILSSILRIVHELIHMTVPWHSSHLCLTF